MATAIDAELKLPQHVKDFNMDAFLTSLGYSIQQVGSEDMMGLPPTGSATARGRKVLQGVSRRRVLATPPSRRR
jgi:hypothetical protein